MFFIGKIYEEKKKIQHNDSDLNKKNVIFGAIIYICVNT